MKKLTRRTFLKSSFLTAASLSIPVRSWARVVGANSTVRAAVIGIGGRGNNHIKGMRALADKGVRVVALCDVDKNFLRRQSETFEKRNEPVESFTDLRKMLEDPNIDVVTIATPNHWHALAAIWAVQAGKDVYVEKPVSHNVWEGRKIVEAARQYGRIVQTGTQSRSVPAIQQAVNWVNEGNLGKIVLARGVCYKRRDSIGKADGPQAIPTELEYDLWCGPAPKEPVMRQRLHYDWHWFWNFGNGELGNTGIHQMDVARWFLGANELSPRVFSVGGRFGYMDDGETPNTQIAYHDYPRAPLIFEVRGLPEKTGAKDLDKYRGSSIGIIIDCENGYVQVGANHSTAAFDHKGKEIHKWQQEGDSDHYANFIQAVNSRKHTDLNADILEGHLSSALCHTGNISYRLGEQASPDVIREKFKADKDAVETFDRMQEHLAANGVDLNKTKPILGEFLKMNSITEQFIDNSTANQLLTRKYRAPYIVPEKV